MQKIILHNYSEINDYLDSLETCNLLPISLWKELVSIASSKNDSIVFLALFDNGLVAGAVCSLMKRRVAGVIYQSLFLYGYDFFDFNPLYVLSKYSSFFKSFIKDYSKKNNCDLIILENLYSNSISFSSIFSFKEDIYLLNKAKNDFSFIYAKRGLKRCRNTLVKKFDYSVRHYTGDEISDEHINLLSKFHKERWAFDNIKSSFYLENRDVFFKTQKANKLLTIIYISDEILVMHYGIINENSLLFHTPVVNIKYYKYSPMIVLLLESAVFCEKNGFNEFNFGLGQENYKLRFSNDTSYISTFYIPLNFIANIKLFPTFILSLLKPKFLIMESFCKKIYRSFLKFRKPLNFYKIKVENFKVDKTLTGVRFHQIVDYTDLVDFFRSVNYKLERYHYKRMMNNDVFYYLAFDDKIVCYGWSTKKALFVSEISRVLKIDNGVILYDFFTDPSFRNRGYYQYLLKKIIEKSDYGLFAYIYALTTNLASNKAILKAGFKKVKTKKLF